MSTVMVERVEFTKIERTIEFVQENNNETLSSTESSKSRNFTKHSTAFQVLEGIDLTGKVFLITGGNSGIGYETARGLALHNATVVIACRNIAKAAAAIENIKSEKDDANITFIQIDNADLESVEKCAESFKAKHKSLHCLILNAGVYNPLHRITDNEFEATFQINYLAHFYLTRLLLPILKSSAPARVVVVSGDAHRRIGGHLTQDKITWEHLSPTHKHDFNSAAYAYGLSKLCTILFSNEFNQQYAPLGITANSVNPGLTNTNIGQNSKVVHSILKLASPLIKSPDQGAATVVYCATAPEMKNVGGKYLSNCRVVSPSTYARNDENAQLVWELSELMLKTYLQQKERTLLHLNSNQATNEM